MLELMAEVKAQGLPEQRACQVLGINPRSLQRWRRPVSPAALAPACQPPRPYNALLRAEVAAVVSVIRSPAHADQSCRELALSLENKPESPVLTPQQVHTGQTATLLAVRAARQAQALANRRQAPRHPFTLEELIAQPLPDVSHLPVYSWAGPDLAPQNGRHSLRN